MIRSTMSGRRWSAVSLANLRDDSRGLRREMMRSMKTVSEASPIVTRKKPTTFAGRPMWAHISAKLNPITVFLSSGREPEGNRDDLIDRDRLPLVTCGLEVPVLDRRHRGAREGLLSAHEL